MKVMSRKADTRAHLEEKVGGCRLWLMLTSDTASAIVVQLGGENGNSGAAEQGDEQSRALEQP